ncbi:hypothetical protein [Gorillibacterium massiliense]|uniref:hypothetical protein n=1 Tax=Gorillibacterium massiliense TaxID=1280390 RepID=UPI000593BD3A|nr:hypothetical protein [Gorillibacterium massiliense]
MEASKPIQTKKILKKARELSLLLENEKDKLSQTCPEALFSKLQQACNLVQQSIVELENYERSFLEKKQTTVKPKVEIDIREINSITVDNFLINDNYSVYKYFEDVFFTEYVSNSDDALKKLSLTDLKFMYYLLTGILIKGKVTKNEVFSNIKSYLDNQKRTKTML